MGNTSTNQQQSVFPYTPSWLTGYYRTGANQAQQAQGSLPSLSNLYNQVPLLNVPNLNTNQLNDISRFQSSVGNTGISNRSNQALESFLGTPGTPSSATNAALKEFRDISAPEINQQSVLMGQGNSGAALDALARGQEQALVPFMQQDLSNTLSAAGQLGQQDIAQRAQTQSELSNALNAANLQYQNQLAKNQAAYDQQTGRFNYASALQQGPLGDFGNLIGQIQRASSSATQPKF